MDKISGLILDVNDDRDGEVLRSIFPTPESLPDLVKTAHAVTEEERGVLPDDAFALVLVNDGVELKKYATIDPGNTALSVEYFLKTGHKLPVEAQKVAATNLLAACGWYGIEAPELLKEAASDKLALNLRKVKRSLDNAPERPPMISGLKKEAFGVGTALGVMGMASQAGTVKKNLRAARGSKQILTPSQISRRAGTGL